jgi:L-rhamnose mutarotase
MKSFFRLPSFRTSFFPVKPTRAVLPLLFAVLAACHSPEHRQVRRFGMVTGIKTDKIAYYEQLHAAIWPAVLHEIRQCHIRNYSIYIQRIGDSSFLFSYFEYTGMDFAGDMQKMAGDSATRRWWRETDPTQLPLPGAAARKEIWTNMQEVFHAD